MSALRRIEDIFLLHYISSGHQVQMTAALSGYCKMKRDRASGIKSIRCYTVRRGQLRQTLGKHCWQHSKGKKIK